jgi:ATP phosphoribosyltransferase regulatory subunit
MVRDLVDLNGGVEVLEEARESLAGAGAPVAAALEELARVHGTMQARMPEVPLYFDLAELRGYRYQTGVVFAAFVPGHGQELARGGRYDALGAVFGRSRPATGFSADLKTLVKLSTAAAEAGPVPGILAPWDDDPLLQREVAALRAAGERVVQALPGQSGGAADVGCDRELIREGGGWTVARTGA